MSEVDEPRVRAASDATRGLFIVAEILVTSLVGEAIFAVSLGRAVVVLLASVVLVPALAARLFSPEAIPMAG